jgi:5'-deoxynucleotidase YfbR-like HD superfamily hydrolase
MKTVRNGMRVRRFHTVDLLVSETVGHHSANVAMLCHVLHPDASKELILAALTHDLVEQHTGDIPATAKWEHPTLAMCLAAIEDVRTEYEFELTDIERRVMKQADMLDLCYKCMEEMSMGNMTVLPILQRGMLHLRSNAPLHMTETLLKGIENELSK